MQNRSPHSLQSITTYQKLRGACFDLTLPLFKDGVTYRTGRIDRCGAMFLGNIQKVHQHLPVRAFAGRMRELLIHAMLCHSPVSGPRRGGIGKIICALLKR